MTYFHLFKRLRRDREYREQCQRTTERQIAARVALGDKYQPMKECEK